MTTVETTVRCQDCQKPVAELSLWQAYSRERDPEAFRFWCSTCATTRPGGVPVRKPRSPRPVLD